MSFVHSVLNTAEEDVIVKDGVQKGNLYETNLQSELPIVSHYILKNRLSPINNVIDRSAKVQMVCYHPGLDKSQAQFCQASPGPPTLPPAPPHCSTLPLRTHAVIAYAEARQRKCDEIRQRKTFIDERRNPMMTPAERPLEDNWGSRIPCAIHKCVDTASLSIENFSDQSNELYMQCVDSIQDTLPSAECRRYKPSKSAMEFFKEAHVFENIISECPTCHEFLNSEDFDMNSSAFIAAPLPETQVYLNVDANTKLNVKNRCGCCGPADLKIGPPPSTKELLTNLSEVAKEQAKIKFNQVKVDLSIKTAEKIREVMDTYARKSPALGIFHDMLSRKPSQESLSPSVSSSSSASTDSIPHVEQSKKPLSRKPQCAFMKCFSSFKRSKKSKDSVRGKDSISKKGKGGKRGGKGKGGKEFDQNNSFQQNKGSRGSRHSDVYVTDGKGSRGSRHSDVYVTDGGSKGLRKSKIMSKMPSITDQNKGQSSGKKTNRKTRLRQGRKVSPKITFADGVLPNASSSSMGQGQSSSDFERGLNLSRSDQSFNSPSEYGGKLVPGQSIQDAARAYATRGCACKNTACKSSLLGLSGSSELFDNDGKNNKSIQSMALSTDGSDSLVSEPTPQQNTSFFFRDKENKNVIAKCSCKCQKRGWDGHKYYFPPEGVNVSSYDLGKSDNSLTTDSVKYGQSQKTAASSASSEKSLSKRTKENKPRRLGKTAKMRGQMQNQLTKFNQRKSAPAESYGYSDGMLGPGVDVRHGDAQNIDSSSKRRMVRDSGNRRRSQVGSENSWDLSRGGDFGFTGERENTRRKKYTDRDRSAGDRLDTRGQEKKTGKSTRSGEKKRMHDSRGAMDKKRKKHDAGVDEGQKTGSGSKDSDSSESSDSLDQENEDKQFGESRRQIKGRKKDSSHYDRPLNDTGRSSRYRKGGSDSLDRENRQKGLGYTETAARQRSGRGTTETDAVGRHGRGHGASDGQRKGSSSDSLDHEKSQRESGYGRPAGQQRNGRSQSDTDVDGRHGKDRGASDGYRKSSSSDSLDRENRRRGLGYYGQAGQQRSGRSTSDTTGDGWHGRGRRAGDESRGDPHSRGRSTSDSIRGGRRGKARGVTDTSRGGRRGRSQSASDASRGNRHGRDRSPRDSIAGDRRFGTRSLSDMSRGGRHGRSLSASDASRGSHRDRGYSRNKVDHEARGGDSKRRSSRSRHPKDAASVKQRKRGLSRESSQSRSPSDTAALGQVGRAKTSSPVDYSTIDGMDKDGKPMDSIKTAGSGDFRSKRFDPKTSFKNYFLEAKTYAKQSAASAASRKKVRPHRAPAPLAKQAFSGKNIFKKQKKPRLRCRCTKSKVKVEIPVENLMSDLKEAEKSVMVAKAKLKARKEAEKEKFKAERKSALRGTKIASAETKESASKKSSNVSSTNSGGIGKKKKKCARKEEGKVIMVGKDGKPLTKGKDGKGSKDGGKDGKGSKDGGKDGQDGKAGASGSKKSIKGGWGKRTAARKSKSAISNESMQNYISKHSHGRSCTCKVCYKYKGLKKSKKAYYVTTILRDQFPSYVAAENIPIVANECYNSNVEINTSSEEIFTAHYKSSSNESLSISEITNYSIKSTASNNRGTDVITSQEPAIKSPEIICLDKIKRFSRERNTWMEKNDMNKPFINHTDHLKESITEQNIYHVKELRKIKENVHNTTEAITQCHSSQESYETSSRSVIHCSCSDCHCEDCNSFSKYSEGRTISCNICTSLKKHSLSQMINKATSDNISESSTLNVEDYSFDEDSEVASFEYSNTTNRSKNKFKCGLHGMNKIAKTDFQSFNNRLSGAIELVLPENKNNFGVCTQKCQNHCNRSNFEDLSASKTESKIRPNDSSSSYTILTSNAKSSKENSSNLERASGEKSYYLSDSVVLKPGTESVCSCQTSNLDTSKSNCRYYKDIETSLTECRHSSHLKKNICEISKGFKTKNRFTDNNSPRLAISDDNKRFTCKSPKQTTLKICENTNNLIKKIANKQVSCCSEQFFEETDTFCRENQYMQRNSVKVEAAFNFPSTETLHKRQKPRKREICCNRTGNAYVQQNSQHNIYNIAVEPSADNPEANLESNNEDEPKADETEDKEGTSETDESENKQSEDNLCECTQTCMSTSKLGGQNGQPFIIITGSNVDDRLRKMVDQFLTQENNSSKLYKTILSASSHGSDCINTCTERDDLIYSNLTVCDPRRCVDNECGSRRRVSISRGPGSGYGRSSSQQSYTKSGSRISLRSEENSKLRKCNEYNCEGIQRQEISMEPACFCADKPKSITRLNCRPLDGAETIEYVLERVTTRDGRTVSLHVPRIMCSEVSTLQAGSLSADETHCLELQEEKRKSEQNKGGKCKNLFKFFKKKKAEDEPPCAPGYAAGPWRATPRGSLKGLLDFRGILDNDACCDGKCGAVSTGKHICAGKKKKPGCICLYALRLIRKNV